MTPAVPTVDLERLLRFIFPPGLQHPLTNGRLYAFCEYGPLDADGQLRSGKQGQHVVASWELDEMCRQFERDHILRVYVPLNRPLHTLSEAQKEECIVQADAHLKRHHGRGYLPQLSRDEVRRLLAPLAADPATGAPYFHEVQLACRKHWELQVTRHKLVFPNITVAGGAPSAVAETGKMPPAGADATVVTVTVAMATKNGRISGSDGSGASGRRVIVAAPRSRKPRGLNDAELSTRTLKMLSTRVFKIADLEDGSNPVLTENVKLIRDDSRGTIARRDGTADWDGNCCTRGMSLGARVAASRSATTAKQRTG